MSEHVHPLKMCNGGGHVTLQIKDDKGAVLDQWDVERQTIPEGGGGGGG